MRTAYKIKHHHIPKQGMSICSQFLGFFGQRLYFRNPEKYYKKIKADSSKCIGCGLCAIDCPMANISIIHGTAQFNSSLIRSCNRYWVSFSIRHSTVNSTFSILLIFYLSYFLNIPLGINLFP